MTNPILQLILLSDVYCAATAKTRIALSKRVFNDGKVIDKLCDGGDLTTTRHQMALRWFSDNWPEGAEWPSDVSRPVSAGEEAA